MSFRLKVVATIILLTTSIMILILWMAIDFLQKELTTEINNSNINTINQLKTYSIMNAVVTDNYGSLQNDFESIIENNNLDEILLFDKKNVVVASSDANKIGSVVGANDFDKRWGVDRIEVGGAYAGSLVYFFNNNTLASAKRETLTLGLTLILIGVILMAVVGYFSGAWLTRRLEAMVNSLDIITSGHIEKFRVDESNDEVGMLSRFVHEIGEKIAAQKEELLDSEERMRIALQSAGAGAWKYDLKNGSVFWSSKIYQMFGLMPSDEGPPMKLWSSYIHPDDMPLVTKALAALFEKRENLSVEYRIIRRSGTVRWVRSIGRLFVDSNDEPVVAYGMLFDISHEKNDYSALENEKNLLSTMLDISGECFIVTSVKNDIVVATQKAKELFGIGEIAKQMNMDMFFSDQSIKDIERALEEKFSITLRDGTELPYFFSIKVFSHQDLNKARFSIINFHLSEK